jgi:hypothetical protein
MLCSSQSGTAKWAWIRLATVAMSIAAALYPHQMNAEISSCRHLVPPGGAGVFALALPDGKLTLALALGGAVLAVAAFLLVRKLVRSRRSGGRARSASQRPAPVAASATKPRLQTSLSGLGGVESHGKVNGVNGTNGHHSSRRKKVFDYNRYFTDLMSAVSSSGLIETAPIDSPRASDAQSASEGGERLSSVSVNLRSAQMEFLANQKALIEEQKRLIQEQSRLIEEKSKLIAEKNQLLKMQSEWIDSKAL